MSETVDADLQPLLTPKTASGAAARSASRCRASSLRVRDDDGQPLRRRRDRRHRGAGARTCSRATGACPRRRRKSSPPTAGSDRRRRQDRRARLRHDRRPQQGPDHQRRLQRLSGRDRGLHQRACPAWPRARWSACRTPTSARSASRSSIAEARRDARRRRADRRALKAQLANFKVPKRCFVVDELPRNAMGKVQKNLLREQHKRCSRRS